MKKVIICLLIVFCAVNICACNNTKDSNSEQQLVGTWISKETIGDLYSFRLLDNGRAIWISSHDSSREGKLVTEEDDVYSGEWMVDENRVIIFYSTSTGDSAYILNLTKENNLKWDDKVFTKVER